MTTVINNNEILGTYENGNYTVSIYSDGTKVRDTKKKKFQPAFAENCDVKITSVCNGNCAFCYEGCTPDGEHAELLNQKWVQTLHPYTELALNGNDLTHPQLIPFLHLLKLKKIIANITVNQKHFMQHKDILRKLVSEKLIYGIGVSLVEATDEFIESVSEFDNIVIHTIAGILSVNDVQKLSDKNIKLLILGYKEKNRGIDYKTSHNEEINSKKEMLKYILPSMQNKFNVISFDNLALEQLDVKNVLNISDKDWKKIYMGDDGKFTFYIDMVDKRFATNSVSETTYPIMDSVDDMFNFLQSENK